MTRYLLIANQTLGGRELDREIQQRIATGPAEFHVVVPMTEPRHEAQDWVPADPIYAIPARVEATAEAIDEARRRSEHRLGRIVERIRDLGGVAEGEVGPSDAYAAATEALERIRPDAVIVSTLPAGISRWIKMDLPSRLERAADVPVTTVEAEVAAHA